MIEIIPAIDIIGGKCVRLTKGDYSSQTIYSDDPVDVAKRFADCGCNRLHLVDLDGAKASHVVNHGVLERICAATTLVVDFGGGVKTDEDVKIALNSGAKMITGGSVAVKNAPLFYSWLSKYGSDVVILGADARDGKIASNGWVEDSELDIVPFVTEFIQKGGQKVISTDISSDGTLDGPALMLYKKLIDTVNGVCVIASGGVGCMDDVRRLDEISVPAVIVGKAIYENRITLRELEYHNLNS